MHTELSVLWSLVLFEICEHTRLSESWPFLLFEIVGDGNVVTWSSFEADPNDFQSFVWSISVSSYLEHAASVFGQLRSLNYRERRTRAWMASVGLWAVEVSQERA